MTLKLNDSGPLVARWRTVMAAMFTGYARRIDPATGTAIGPLPAGSVFGPRAVQWQQEYERSTRQTVDGVVSDQDMLNLRIVEPSSQVKPIIFTVEGHMSDMKAGPAAFTAQELEKEGVCHWQPIGYNDTALPFDDESGIQELHRLVGAQRMDNGVPFPPGTPWGLIVFSQGAIIGSDFMRRHALAGDLNWRLPDFRRGLAFGNPDRENGQCAPWVPDPPKPGTQGISDTLFNVTRTVIADRWREVARTGDLYAENTTDDIGLDKTMIYKMVATSDWFGGPAGILSRVMAMFTNPLPEVYDAAVAIIEAIGFAANMGPHGIYDLGPCVDWMRGVAK